MPHAPNLAPSSTPSSKSPTDQPTPVILSWGLGVDSSAILARWLLDPTSRDFDLADLIVLVAMTGDEHPSTGRVCTEHLLPLLREHQVRLVQLARGGPSQRDGIVVLDDSRHPRQLHLNGAWRLSDELRASGTVPMVATNRRTCSIKFKGWVLDTWISRELGDRPFRHILGFNDDEHFRVARDQSYSTVQRSSQYPLLDWAWGRTACEDYLTQTFGEPFPKSCCTFCPFAGNKAGLPRLLDRWSAEPEGARTALMLEHVARALNPASKLFGARAALDAVREAGRTDLLDAHQRDLDASAWSLYRVRRIIHARGGDPAKKGPAWRSVTPLVSGTFDEALTALEAHAAAADLPVTDAGDGVPRIWLRNRAGSYPTTEEMLTLAPALVHAKERPGFATAWTALVEAPQLELFTAG